MRRYLFFLLFLITHPVSAANTKTVIFWLSIDGLSPTYLSRAKVPRLQEMMKHSLYSLQLAPIFPSITFPSHCSQATGVKVKDHGIPFNTFYDSKSGETYSYPNDSSLLEAEPIWQTAKRGGLRSAVFNWPLSFKQTGEFKSDYFNEIYENELSDEQRVDRALLIWEQDRGKGQRLNLIMAYIVGPDSLGHTLGPDHEKVFEVVGNVDRLVGRLQDKIKEIAKADKDKSTQYYLLLTSDHGMTKVKFAVNFNMLLGLPNESEVKLLPGGGIGHVFLDKVHDKDRLELIIKLKKEIKKHTFAKIYEKQEMPKEWQYDHPTRVGDLVVILDPGYAFMKVSKIAVPITDIVAPRGMHGYHHSLSKDMYGLMVLWRYPEISSSVEIKSPVDSLKLHPTVAKLLSITPSVKAKERPIKELQYLER